MAVASGKVSQIIQNGWQMADNAQFAKDGVPLIEQSQKLSPGTSLLEAYARTKIFSYFNS